MTTFQPDDWPHVPAGGNQLRSIELYVRCNARGDWRYEVTRVPGAHRIAEGDATDPEEAMSRAARAALDWAAKMSPKEQNDLAALRQAIGDVLDLPSPSFDPESLLARIHRIETMLRKALVGRDA